MAQTLYCHTNKYLGPNLPAQPGCGKIQTWKVFTEWLISRYHCLPCVAEIVEICRMLLDDCSWELILEVS